MYISASVTLKEGWVKKSHHLAKLKLMTYNVAKQ